MRAHPVVWALRATWLVLPFTLGDSIAAALDGRSPAVGVVAAVGAWALWAVVMGAALIALPPTLTLLRLFTPVAPLVAVTTLTIWVPDDLSTGRVVLGAAGLAASLVAMTTAWSGATADAYIDGASYGDERRFALRVPIAFLMGPVPMFWLASVGSGVVGPLLLAAEVWVPGAAVTAMAVLTAVPAAKAFHGLSRRWLVFVPAGTTLIDHLGLVDPVLFPARQMSRLGPALAGTAATDLTQNATGLVLEIALDAAVEVTARTSRAGGELQLVRAVLVSPVRPGAVMAEATRRGLPTPATAASRTEPVS